MVKAFYESIHYESLRERRIRRSALGGNITFSDSHPVARDGILDYFETTSFERVGILRGEYLLHAAGLLLVDLRGVLTSACLPPEDWSAAHALAMQSVEPTMTSQIRLLLENSDQLPFAENPPVFCDPYPLNYFHFSLELIPRMRHFAEYARAPLVMEHNSLSRPFQRDLLSRVASGMEYFPVGRGIRVRDPILAHGGMSEEGIFWLRRASGISAMPGRRKIYICRAATGTRTTSGGGISESVGFQTLLRDFGFETVDFGNGEHGVAAQVAMLEGAGLILSAHGAALTNLAFLNPKLTVVEVMGSRTSRACFMHIAATLGFDYHGIFSSTYDEQSDIVVDLDELRDELRRRLPV